MHIIYELLVPVLSLILIVSLPCLFSVFPNVPSAPGQPCIGEDRKYRQLHNISHITTKNNPDLCAIMCLQSPV